VDNVQVIDFLPTCPRLHPGMMVSDDSYRYGREWVCRVCGTRLYGNDQGGAELPAIASEQPISGRPRKNRRNNTTHYRFSKDGGGRNGRGGKLYE